MFRLSIIISLFYALLLASILTETCSADSLYKQMDNGEKLFNEEKFDESLNTFIDTQIEFPENPEVKYNIACTHYKMKNYDEAIKGYLDVAATARNVELEEMALYNIGNTLYRQGKLQEATEYYRKALDLDPKDIDAQQNLEFVLEEIKKKINEAKKTAQDQQQKQEQQKSGEQKQEQKQEQQKSGKNEPSDTDSQEQQNGSEQDKQQAEVKQDRDVDEAEHGQKDSESQENKKDGDEGSAAYAQQMTKDEAEQLLNNIQENRDKFKNTDKKTKGNAPYRPAKDW